MAAWFYIVLFVIGSGLFCIYARFGHLMRCIFFTAFTGLAALGLLWLAGGLVGLELSLTPLTTLLSAVLGIPGVIAMLVFNLM